MKNVVLCTFYLYLFLYTPVSRTSLSEKEVELDELRNMLKEEKMKQNKTLDSLIRESDILLCKGSKVNKI